MISRICYPVTERRLKPIYDSLDFGNNKKALQESEKVLRKQPNLQCAKVLKCLALLRLGREDDCVEQLEIIRSECPVEESTLQLMSVCYRDINKPNIICQLYENANKKDPGSEEILNNLFISYVRIGDYKRQKQTALALNKLNAKNQYYFWAIVIILLESVENITDLVEVFCEPIYSPLICAKDRPYSYNYLKVDEVNNDNKKDLNLKIAERMLEKFLVTNKIETEQEFLVFLAVLQMQKNYEKALETLESPLFTLLDESSLLNMKLYFLAKLNRWVDINVIMREELQNGLDGWNYLLYYIDSCYELSKECSLGENDEFLKAQEFIETLAQKRSSTKKRGLYLAQLELSARFSCFTNILHYLVKYFKEFGSKEACVHDLKPYLQLLSPESRLEFLRLICYIYASDVSLHSDLCELMNYHICNKELNRVMSCSVVFEDTFKHIGELLLCFIDALEFNVGLPATETRSSDRYALLALYNLYDLYIDMQSCNYLFQAIVICCYALLHSPSNSQFKLLLLKFYHLLGASDSANDTYLSLDVKHMQLDTLGYLHVFPLIATGSYTHACSVMDSTLKFFTNNRKESTDNIAFAYKYDAYTKIPEIIAIKEKLNNSIHYHEVNVERMLLLLFKSENHSSALQLLKDFNFSPETDQIPWNSLTDNRDLKVLWNLEPECRSLSEKEIIVSYNFQIVYLRLRNLLLRSIVSGFEIGMCEMENNADMQKSKVKSFIASKELLENLTTELEQVVKQMKLNPPKPFSKSPSIASPPKTRLSLVLRHNYFDIVLNELWFLLCLIPEKENGEDECKCRLGAIIILWEEFASSFPIRSQYAEERSHLLQLCSLYVELLSFSSIIVGICDSVLNRMKSNSVKKNRKKKNTTRSDVSIDFEWRMNMLDNFVIFLMDTIKEMESLLLSEEKMLNEIQMYGTFDLNNVLKELLHEKKCNDKQNVIKEEWNKLESLSKTVSDKIKNNHVSSVNKILVVLKLKLKYLGSLKLLRKVSVL